VAKAKIDIRSESNQKMDELVEILTAAVERAQSMENERATAGKVVAKLKEIGSRPAGAAGPTPNSWLYGCTPTSWDRQNARSGARRSAPWPQALPSAAVDKAERCSVS